MRGSGCFCLRVLVCMPPLFPPLSLPSQLSSGWLHTCALYQRGGGGRTYAVCWGANSAGQLGVGDLIDRSSVASNSAAIALQGDGSGTGMPTRTASGNAYSCALLSNATLACWGDNSQARTLPLASVCVCVCVVCLCVCVCLYCHASTL